MTLLKFTSPSRSSLTASTCMTRLSHWNNPVCARVSLAATGQENPACLGRGCPCAAWDSQQETHDRTKGMPDRCRLSWSKYLTRLRLVNMVNLNLQAWPASADHASAQWQLLAKPTSNLRSVCLFLFLICCFIKLHHTSRHVQHNRSHKHIQESYGMRVLCSTYMYATALLCSTLPRSVLKWKQLRMI